MIVKFHSAVTGDGFTTEFVKMHQAENLCVLILLLLIWTMSWTISRGHTEEVWS